MYFSGHVLCLLVKIFSRWTERREEKPSDFSRRRVEVVMVDVHAIWMINNGKDRGKKKNQSMRADELKGKRRQNTW